MFLKTAIANDVEPVVQKCKSKTSEYTNHTKNFQITNFGKKAIENQQEILDIIQQINIMICVENKLFCFTARCTVYLQY